MQNRILFIALLGLLLLGESNSVFCQIIDGGYKYFQNYTPELYDEQPQNWCVVQDHRGIIYVANQSGLMQFDGVSWRSIDIPNKIVRSLAIHENGIVFVGGKNEMGFLSIDYYREAYKYQTLTTNIKEAKHRKFGNVYKIHVTKEGVYFDTSNFLFLWDPVKKKIQKVWEADHLSPLYHTLKKFLFFGHAPKFSFFASFTVDGSLYIQKQQRPLMRMVKGKLEEIPGGKAFEGAWIYMIAPCDTDKLLIGTRRRGLFKYDGNKVVPFDTEADDYLVIKKLTHGIRLSSGEFALATLDGGLVIIDSEGRLIEIIDTSYGLQDQKVKYVFEDNQGNLWLALNNGLTKIEYASPISFYDKRSGLAGMVLSVVKHNNIVFAGTGNGLFNTSIGGKFSLTAGITSTTWSLLSTGDSLLAATTHGIIQLENDESNFTGRKLTTASAYVFYLSNLSENCIFVGIKDGLIVLSRKNGSTQWEQAYEYENVTQTIKSIAEDEKGNLWLGLSDSGVLRVSFPSGNPLSEPKVEAYDKNHELPDKPVIVVVAKNKVRYATEDGLYCFDEKKQRFVRDPLLGDEFAGGKEGRSIYRFIEGQDGNVWLHSNSKNIKATLNTDGTYTIEETPFLRIPEIQSNSIYPDPNGKIIWFESHKGLIRYDKEFKKDYEKDFNVLIRKVLVNGELVYDGADTNLPRPIIKYENRNVRFQFAAPFFEDEASTKYKFRLKGYDESWSDWTSETQKDYTNLDARDYIFQVQAKNVYGTLSNVATFPAKVLPPWYQTWWAYLLFAILAAAGIYFFIRWRLGKLEREKKKLEGIIQERTQEIQDKNLQLEEQSEKLKELDKAKSRFFANISHEFRTPLTLLIGPLEQMISACGDNEAERKRKLILMLRNAQRLLRLINQLLDLSRLDSGKMKIKAARIGIVSFIRGLTDSFRILSQQKELDLVFQADSEDEDIFLFIDQRKMEDIMSNLLINALKFTPAGGKVAVSIKANSTKDDTFPEGWVEISVTDTGPGIPAEQMAHIFDRFYTAGDSYENNHNGSGAGIGLALAKELVELHHGTITESSRESHGTNFTVRLPMGKAHLSEDEISDSPVAQSAEDLPVSLDTLAIDLEDENGEGANEIELGTAPEEANIILVVEDSADMREYIKSALVPGYTVVEAMNGKEGIEKAQAIIPDLIISDIMMPEMDGYEMSRILKSDIRTSHVPIILLTAKASEENILEGLETGADDYITKPFSTKILSAKIKNLIEVRSQLQANINRELTLRPVKTTVSKMDSEFLRDLQGVIKENLSDPEFNVEELCKKLYMSNTTLYRKIQALCGQTPTEFIRSCRLKRALQLLQNGFGSVTEVAFEVGFSSRAYFTKCFKEKFHQLPSNFQDAQ